MRSTACQIVFGKQPTIGRHRHSQSKNIYAYWGQIHYRLSIASCRSLFYQLLYRFQWQTLNWKKDDRSWNNATTERFVEVGKFVHEKLRLWHRQTIDSVFYAFGTQPHPSRKAPKPNYDDKFYIRFRVQDRGGQTNARLWLGRPEWFVSINLLWPLSPAAENRRPRVFGKQLKPFRMVFSGAIGNRTKEIVRSILGSIPRTRSHHDHVTPR